MENKIEITDVKVYPFKNSLDSWKGVASIILNDTFLVRDQQVIMEG